MTNIQRFWYLADILDAIEAELKTNDKTRLYTLYNMLGEAIRRNSVRERATLLHE